MYNSPRRPYYNRTQNMPQSSQNDDSVCMDNKRFWQLLKSLRNRQSDAKKQDDRKPVQSGK
ncbi:MAG: hypothetical protein WBC91_13595 [Phototrophicaceae bacterium]